MRKVVLLLTLIFSSTTVFTQGIEFFQGSWNDALAKAKAENKIIFVDFYTTWCAPCKFMTASVFTDKEVGAYFNSNFINVKIDAEKQELLLVKQSNITAYPTLAFFNPAGELFFRKMGGMDASAFHLLGHQVNSFERNKKAFEENPNNLNALGPYIQILSQIEPEKATQIATEYLKNLPVEESKKPGNWELIYTYEKNPESKFFKYSLTNFRYFIDSLPGYQDYFANVSGIILQEAITEKNESKLTQYKSIALNAMQEMGMAEADGFMLEVDIYYYAQTNQLEKQLAAMDNWIMNYITDVEVISNNTTEIMDKHGKIAFDYCLKWANKTISLQNSSYAYLTVSFVYRENGMKAEALKYAQKSLELASPEDDTEYIKQFIEEINKMQ